MRRTAGLVETRTHEWLLDIEFRKRETFAYSCETYGWIVEHAQTKKDRLAHAEEFAEGAHRFVEERLDPEELADIVREACAARNGWKVILSRCAPTKLVRQKVNSLVIGSNE